MVSDAEQQQAQLEHLNEVQGATSDYDDPELPRIGRILRKTSLMNSPTNQCREGRHEFGGLVLPVPTFMNSMKTGIAEFSVRPGITCLWQVNGSALSFEKWMELDLGILTDGLYC